MELSNRDYGKLCRKVLLDHLVSIFGDLRHEGLWFFSLNNDKILTLYSNIRDDKWFYGIIPKYWENWDENSYLILIMRDGIRCSYTIMNPNESKILISKINLSRDNQKKINVRIPSAGKIYIQEWPEFHFAERIIYVGNIDPETAKSEKLIKQLGLLRKHDLEKLLAILKQPQTDQDKI